MLKGGRSTPAFYFPVLLKYFCKHCLFLSAALDSIPLIMLHRHPCSCEEYDCQSTNIRHYNVVQNLIHQQLIKLPYPALITMQSLHSPCPVPDEFILPTPGCLSETGNIPHPVADQEVPSPHEGLVRVLS